MCQCPQVGGRRHRSDWSACRHAPLVYGARDHAACTVACLATGGDYRYWNENSWLVKTSLHKKKAADHIGDTNEMIGAADGARQAPCLQCGRAPACGPSAVG